MSNLFNSNYVSTPVTGGTTLNNVVEDKKSRTYGTAPLPDTGILPKPYNPEPQRYGLGKPRRIVIRGKIAID